MSSSSCPTLAIFGTASDVGKSLISAGLCRILSDAGYRVAPFKAQNMSNNSGVTTTGKEMGRAQLVQAAAARVEPHEDMNPVLLKPGGEDGSQVVLLGLPWKHQDAKSYFREAPRLREHAFGALKRLRAAHDCVVIEGAGSCAEVNLRAREFVNFPCAHQADATVILVADIDRGGVFAQVVGSLEVMPPEDRTRVGGIIVNRFRGNRELFDDGVRYLEERTGLPVLGVVPYLYGLAIESEDSLHLHAKLDPPPGQEEEGDLRVAVLRLPHISNSTDFDALSAVPGVTVHFLSRVRDLDVYDIVLLPGSKNVRADLAWLKQNEWDVRLRRHHERGRRIGGICGGYQMMGQTIFDPQGVEGPAGSSPGLGFFPCTTILKTEKVLTQVEGTWTRYGTAVRGYEIHVGDTSPSEQANTGTPPSGTFQTALVHTQKGKPLGTVDGSISDDGRIWGTYLHGLFDEPEFLRAFLTELRPEQAEHWKTAVRDNRRTREAELQRLAQHLAEHLDLPRLFEMAGFPFSPSGGAIRTDPRENTTALGSPD